MPFYEVVFETGRNSVAFYEDDAEALSAVSAHHARAKKGERALASADTSPPAERIVNVLVYDRHPNDLNLEQAMSSDVLTKEVTDLITSLADANGVVAVDQLAVAVRQITHPMVDYPGAHDSIYKMEESAHLDPSEWEGTE